MKVLLKGAVVLTTVVMAICDLLDLLILPALFVVIGLLNQFDYRYYVISIGAYLLLLLLIELGPRLIFKALNKKYTPLIERKLEKVLSKRFKEQ